VTLTFDLMTLKNNKVPLLPRTDVWTKFEEGRSGSVLELLIGNKKVTDGQTDWHVQSTSRRRLFSEKTTKYNANIIFFQQLYGINLMASSIFHNLSITDTCQKYNKKPNLQRDKTAIFYGIMWTLCAYEMFFVLSGITN